MAYYCFQNEYIPIYIPSCLLYDYLKKHKYYIMNVNPTKKKKKGAREFLLISEN